MTPVVLAGIALGALLAAVVLAAAAGPSPPAS